MAPRRDSIETAMNTIILNIFAVQATLIHEILAGLLIDVVDHNSPTIISVYPIAVTRRIDNVQSQSNASFLNVQCLFVDPRGLLTTLLDRCHLTILIKIGEEEAVDER